MVSSVTVKPIFAVWSQVQLSGYGQSQNLWAGTASSGVQSNHSLHYLVLQHLLIVLWFCTISCISVSSNCAYSVIPSPSNIFWTCTLCCMPCPFFSIFSSIFIFIICTCTASKQHCCTHPQVVVAVDRSS